MDPKVREKSKAVFRTILKICEEQRKADTSDEEISSTEKLGHTTRRFNLPKHTRRS